MHINFTSVAMCSYKPCSFAIFKTKCFRTKSSLSRFQDGQPISSLPRSRFLGRSGYTPTLQTICGVGDSVTRAPLKTTAWEANRFQDNYQYRLCHVRFYFFYLILLKLSLSTTTILYHSPKVKTRSHQV